MDTIEVTSHVILQTVSQHPAEFWIVAAISVFLLSLAKSGFGGALASTSVPVMLLIASPTQTLAILLPMFLLTSVGVVFIWYQHCNWRVALIMCLFALVGQGVGWLLFDYFSDQMLTLCIGLVAMVTAVQYWASIIGAKPETKTAEWAEKRIWKRGGFWCGLSGISSFISLSGGIPAQIFLLPHRLSREAFVGTFSVYFVIIDILKGPLYLQLDVLSVESLKVSAMLLPVIPLGVFVGWWLNKRMNDRIFYHISYGFLLIIGVKLLVDSCLDWGI